MAMDDKIEPSPSNDKPNPPLCEECNNNPSKYKCPGCSLRSCSLPCVNSHKQRTSCTGKRPLTNFVPISQFNDNQLISDYNMLEDVKRIADSARRTRLKVCGYSHMSLPFHLKSLRNAAWSRRTRLQFLPNGMSKRVKNKTYYNNRKKFISWTIEWRFHSTDVVLLDHGIHENSTLSSVIEKHLQPSPWNHPLREFCDLSLDSLKFFVRKYPKGLKSPYCQLSINAPIREQLADIFLLEYPVIHVFLPCHSYDFVVINNVKPRKVEIKEPDHHYCPSPKGVTFKEEEIEDEGSLDPHVSDLLNNASEKNASDDKPKFEQSPLISNGEKRATSPSHNSEDNNTRHKTCIEELAAIGDLELDFEPSLLDVYPDITPDSNPDDFFDFDGILFEQLEKDLEGTLHPTEEELEEGEIA